MVKLVMFIEQLQFNIIETSQLNGQHLLAEEQVLTDIVSNGHQLITLTGLQVEVLVILVPQ